MGMPKSRLLASAASIESIEKIITEFYGGTEFKVESVPYGHVLKRVSDGAIPQGVCVIKKGSRYRFELI